MATFLKGILGGFSGLVGTVVGSTWLTLDVMKSRPKPSSVPPVQSQIDQRFKFGLVTGFLARLGDLIEQGFLPTKKATTPMNAAVAYHLKNAITGATPHFNLDYTKMVFTTGRLESAENGVIATPAAKKISVTWDPTDDTDVAYKAIRDTDGALCITYCPLTDNILKTYFPSVRGKNQATITVTMAMTAKVNHVFLFFMTADKKTVSRSQYLGSVTPTAV